MTRRWIGFWAVAVLAAGAAGCMDQPAAAPRDESAPAALPDARLIDEEGHRVRFTEVVGDRVAVVNAFFTSCKEICPAMAATLAGVADGLGSHLGDDVVMISLSLDPETDTPERLRAFAAQHGGRPGWRFMTGDRVEVARLLDRLGLGGVQKEQHTPVFLVGAPGRTAWTRASGFSDPAVVVRQVLALVDGT